MIFIIHTPSIQVFYHCIFATIPNIRTSELMNHVHKNPGMRYGLSHHLLNMHIHAYHVMYTLDKMHKRTIHTSQNKWWYTWLYPQDTTLNTRYHGTEIHCVIKYKLLDILLSTFISLYMRSKHRSSYVRIHLIQ